MAGIGLGFAVHWLLSGDRSDVRVLVYMMPFCVLGALLGIAAGFGSMTPSTREFMYSFWKPGAALGIATLWRPAKGRTLLLLGPLTMAGGAAVAQQYPSADG
jgi:hypothetical protein